MLGQGDFKAILQLITAIFKQQDNLKQTFNLIMIASEVSLSSD